MLIGAIAFMDMSKDMGPWLNLHHPAEKVDITHIWIFSWMGIIDPIQYSLGRSMCNQYINPLGDIIPQVSGSVTIRRIVK
jgi:hypothetical protein